MQMQTVVKVKVVKVNNYCSIFREGDIFYFKKHCFDLSENSLERYCYASLIDLYDTYSRVRKGLVGNKELFKCRDNGIIEFEVERMPDEFYSFERK